jgi:CHRD domain-containing protein
MRTGRFNASHIWSILASEGSPKGRNAMRRTMLFTTLALAAAAALVLVAAAGGNRGKGNDDTCKRGARSAAVTVFDLGLQPKQEVPRITGLRASGVGNLTLDVTRDSAGAITSGDVVFYVNYKFPGSVTITGLHVHQEKKGVNGPIVVDSGVASFTDADGAGNVTAVVTSASPALLQAILDTPRDYYVNLHTSVNPGGAMRDQLAGCSKRKKDNDDD